MPTAGSVLKNSLVHWPVPLTKRWAQLVPAPYWTATVPETVNA